MKISIDIDGVLANFVEGAVRVANNLWPNRVPKNYSWDNYDGVFSKEEWSIIWNEIKNDSHFWELRPTYEENVKALREFLANESDHEIYYVTSRVTVTGRPVAIQTEQWLVNNSIWPCQNYHAVIPVIEPGLKKFVMADLGIQASIDDLGSTVEECKDVKGHKAFLLDRPWNRDKDYGTRVFTLEQFLNISTGKKASNYFYV